MKPSICFFIVISLYVFLVQNDSNWLILISRNFALYNRYSSSKSSLSSLLSIQVNVSSLSAILDICLIISRSLKIRKKCTKTSSAMHRKLLQIKCCEIREWNQLMSQAQLSYSVSRTQNKEKKGLVWRRKDMQKI